MVRYLNPKNSNSSLYSLIIALLLQFFVFSVWRTRIYELRAELLWISLLLFDQWVLCSQHILPRTLHKAHLVSHSVKACIVHHRRNIFNYIGRAFFFNFRLLVLGFLVLLVNLRFLLSVVTTTFCCFIFDFGVQHWKLLVQTWLYGQLATFFNSFGQIREFLVKTCHGNVWLSCIRTRNCLIQNILTDFLWLPVKFFISGCLLYSRVWFLILQGS